MDNHVFINVIKTESLEVDLEKLYKEGVRDLEAFREPFDKSDVLNYVGDNIDDILRKQFKFIDCEISDDEIDYLMDMFEEYINELSSK